MQTWIQYVLIAIVIVLLIRRFLPTKGLRNLDAEQVKSLLKTPKEHVFVDVREPHEYKGGHIKGFKNIPLSQLSKRVQELNPEQSVVLTCRSGMRSRQAAKILQKNGFKQISHLKTGVSGWHDGFTK